MKLKMFLLRGQVGWIFLMVGLVFGEPENQNQTTASNSSTTTPPLPPAPPTFSKVSCTGKLAKIANSDELYDELLPRVLSDADIESDVIMKKEFLKYLTLSATFASMINCTMATPLYHEPRWIQEDEDDDDSGAPVAGGFLSAVNTLASGNNNQNPLDNSNVLLGVRRILANVFTGNLVGIIQESVGLRSPEGVSTVFTDVLSTLFGSTATAGITGVIGNVTSTVSPNPQDHNNETMSAYYQQVAQQQQYIQQLQEQGVLDQAQAIALHHQLLAHQQGQGQGQQQGQGVGGGGGVGGTVQQQQIRPQQQFRPQQHQQQPQQPRPQQHPQQPQSPGHQPQQLRPQQHPQQPQSPVQQQPDDQLRQYFQQSQLGQGNKATNGVIRRRRPTQDNQPQQNIPASQPLKQQEEDNDYEEEDDE